MKKVNVKPPVDTGSYKGPCDKKKVAECVKEGKYCNVDTGRCLLPKGVKAKINKGADLVVDPKHGLVGDSEQAQAIRNIQQYLKELSEREQTKLDVGVATEFVETGSKPKAAKTSKAVKAPKAAKKTCTTTECAKEGKLCNPETGNCVKDNAENRRKLGMAPKGGGAAGASAEVDYKKMSVKDLREELGKRGLVKSGNKDVLVERLKADDKKPAVTRTTTTTTTTTVKTTVSKKADYDSLTVKDIKAELKKRNITIGKGNKAELVAKLLADDKKRVKIEESPDDAYFSCAEDCDADQVCNLGTGVCNDPKDLPELSSYHVLEYDGGVYFGDKTALKKFASDMNVVDPDIQPATAAKLGGVPEEESSEDEEEVEFAIPLILPAKPAPKPVPEVEDDESSSDEDDDEPIARLVKDDTEAVAEEEEEEEEEAAATAAASVADILEAEAEAGVIEEEEEDVADLAKLAKEVSVEKVLTREQKELVEKIRKCIGI